MWVVFLLITFMDGSQAYEFKAIAGPDASYCEAVTEHVMQNTYPREKAVKSIEVECRGSE